MTSTGSNVEQVLHPTVPLETEADDHVFTKLVTFVLIMSWLVLTSASYYLRAKTLPYLRDAFTVEFLTAVMSISFAGPIFAFLLKGSGIAVLGLSLSTFTAFFLFLGYVHHYRQSLVVAQSVPNNKDEVQICKLRSQPTRAALIMSNIGLLICVGCALPIFFFCANAVICREKPVTVYDAQLLNMDNFLLGWLFPEGQFSLYLDKSPILSPETELGDVIEHILSFIYVSYYFYGYFAVGITALIWLYFFAHQGQSRRTEKFWRASQHVAATWTFSFMATFLLNTFVPARSPRLHLKNKFVHALFVTKNVAEGKAKPSAFGQWVVRTIHHDDTYGSFPSGHVGETLSVALACQGAGKKYQSKFLSIAGNVVMVISVLMATATLWLRYHYFTDVLVAIVVASGSELLTQNLHKIMTFFFKEQLPDASKTPCYSPALLPQTSLTMFTVDESSHNSKPFHDDRISSINSSSLYDAATSFPTSIEDASHEA